MSHDRCPRCNRLCFGTCGYCESHDRQLVQATEETARAAWRSLDVQHQIAESQRETAHEQSEEIKRRRQMAWVEAFAALPQILQQELERARQSSVDALLLLAKVERVLREGSWITLYGLCPAETEIIYAELRKSLVPILQALWDGSEPLQPSAESLVREVARSLLFTDFSALVDCREKTSRLAEEHLETRARLEAEREVAEMPVIRQAQRVAQIEQERRAKRMEIIIMLAVTAGVVVAGVISSLHNLDFVAALVLFVMPCLLLPIAFTCWRKARSLEADLGRAQGMLAELNSQKLNFMVDLQLRAEQLTTTYERRLNSLRDGKIDLTMMVLVEGKRRAGVSPGKNANGPSSSVNRNRPADSTAKWYYAKDKKKLGPVCPETVKAMLNSGELRPDDMVLREGSKKWIPVKFVSDIVPVAGSAQTPS